MRQLVLKGVTGFAVAALALALAGCGEPRGSVKTSEKPAALDVASEKAAAAEPSIDSLRTCIDGYGSAPALSMVDRQPPESPGSAVLGAVGRIDGKLTGLELRKADPTTLSAEVDGETRAVVLENTQLVLVVTVSATRGNASEAKVGDQVHVPLAFASGVAGSSLDLEARLAALKEVCPLGTTIRLYPRSLDESGGAVEALMPAPAILLIAEDDRFVSFDPLVPSERPFGVTTADEFDRAT